MIHNLTTIDEKMDRFDGDEITVRCKVIGEPNRGDEGGEKILQEVDDPRGDLGTKTYLSFWLDEPEGVFSDLRQTEQYVLDAVPGTETPQLPRGETLLVRGIPRVAGAGADRQLYLNVTSVVIREPDLYIGKSEIRTVESCPREYYLSYVKNVYRDYSPFSPTSFKGDVAHRTLERALDEHRDRFNNNDWSEQSAIDYTEHIINEEFAIYLAKCSVCGYGTKGKKFASNAVCNLFTDEQFCEHVANGEEIEPEQPLSEEYGYNGEVDIVIDGVPYDLKTTHNIKSRDKESHREQLKLYLFVLLLEELEPGQDLFELIDDQEGYLVYPNLESTSEVKLERVELSAEDIANRMIDRNEVAEIRNGFSPPSPYNRDCTGCSHQYSVRTGDQNESAEDDSEGTEILPPACTFHCQNERRWPCYEFDETKGVTSECSLFDSTDHNSCDQHLEYRDTDITDHYNGLRSALQEEENARRTGNQLSATIDPDLLEQSGRLVSGLEFVRETNEALIYETESDVVPAATPGDILRVEPAEEGGVGRNLVFLGRQDAQYFFSSTDDTRLRQPDREYVARLGFNTEIVRRRYLPFLDYAERRGRDPRPEHDQSSEPSGAVTLSDPTAVAEYLENDEIFVDVPARKDRSAVLAKVLSAVVTAAYPHPKNPDEVVPENKRRALVLGQRPRHSKIAKYELSGPDHLRMDGFSSGEETIHAGQSRVEIENKLQDAQSLISTTQYALSERHFHELDAGGHQGRTHSENYFDLLVILGAEQITEPEYLYLRDVADRTVLIGDKRRPGPQMVSSEAVDRGLDRSYFEWGHDRYAAVTADEAVSIQYPGQANQFVRQLYGNEVFNSLDGGLSFFGFDGRDTAATDDLVLRSSVRAQNGVGKELEFDITHTTSNPFEVQEAFFDRESLDASRLPESGSVLINDHPMQLVGKRNLDNVEYASSHRIVIRADPSNIPAFSRAFRYNRPEAKIIAQLAGEYEPDVIVTPFEAQANKIRTFLDDEGLSVPVKLPQQLDSTIEGRAIVSITVADGILSPPMTDPEILYSLFTAAEDLLIVGDEQTLRSKDAIRRLVVESATEYHYDPSNTGAAD